MPSSTPYWNRMSFGVFIRVTATAGALVPYAITHSRIVFVTACAAVLVFLMVLLAVSNRSKAKLREAKRLQYKSIDTSHHFPARLSPNPGSKVSDLTKP